MGTIKETFFLGENVVDYTIYAPNSVLEKIIINDIKNINHELIDTNTITHWFYKRSDSENNSLHLIYFLTESLNTSKIINTIYRAFKQLYFDKNLIWKVQLNNYTRDISTYNSDIEIVESIFHRQCNTIISILNLNPLSNSLLWKFAIVYVDTYMALFHMEKAEKLTILSYCINHIKANHKSYLIPEDEVFFYKYDTLKNEIYSLLDKKDATYKKIQAIIQKEVEVIIKSPLFSKEKFQYFVIDSLSRFFKSKKALNSISILYFLYKYENTKQKK